MVSLIKDEACVQANVKVSPDVRIKNIQTFFAGDPVIESRTENTPECSYDVSQMLCLKYSLSFAADVQAASSGIICDPQVQECTEQAAGMQEGPSVTAGVPEVEFFPSGQDAAVQAEPSPSDDTPEEEDCGCGCHQEQDVDVQAGPSVISGVPDEDSVQQQASIEPINTNDKKQTPAAGSKTGRFSGRNIAIPKNTLDRMVFLGLASRYRGR